MIQKLINCCFFLLLVSFICGCDLRQRQVALQKKEDSLNQKQQQLFIKEKILQIKEDSLKQRQQEADSTFKKDNTNFYNPGVIGTWLVTMTCSETSCAGSAIGDTKTEQWTFSHVGNVVIVKAMSGNRLVRIYTGAFNGNRIELIEDRQDDAAQITATIAVNLQLIDANNMSGQRIINRNNNCKVIYDLQIKKTAIK